MSEHESRACSKVPQTRMSSGSEQTSRVHLRPLDPAPRRSDYCEKMGDLKTGMYFYARCAEVATEVDARESVAKANLSLGLCEEKQGHWEEAMKSPRAPARRKFRKLHDIHCRLLDYLQRTRIHCKLQCS